MPRGLVLVALLAACGGTTDGEMVDAGDMPDGQPQQNGGPCLLPPIAQAVATLAGGSQAGTSDGMRGDARFSNPTNVVIAPNGNAFITDFDSDRVRMIDRDGVTTTIMVTRNFERPFGIVSAPNGMLYVETD